MITYRFTANMITLTTFLLYFSVIGIIVPISHSATAMAIESSGADNDSFNAEYARILINGEEYQFETPRRLSDALEQEGVQQVQPMSTDRKDTLAPYAAGTVKLPNAINVYSVQLLDGPQGLGFVLWGQDPYMTFSQSINWDRPLLDMSVVTDMSERLFSEDSERQAPLMRDVKRIIWYIREDPANTFVAIAHYDDGRGENESSGGSSSSDGDGSNRNDNVRVGDPDIDDASLFETRVLAYKPTSRLGIDRLIQGQNKAARWRLYGSGSSGERHKVRTLVVAEMPSGTETGNDSGSAVCSVYGRKASPSRKKFVIPMVEGIWVFALGRTFTELTCFPSSIGPISNFSQ